MDDGNGWALVWAYVCREITTPRLRGYWFGKALFDPPAQALFGECCTYPVSVQYYHMCRDQWGGQAFWECT